MDSYDAVVEHLKKAQARGMEVVSNRLEFVLERLDELVREAKSAVDEARPQDPNELFPVAEVESALAELRQQAAATPAAEAPAAAPPLAAEGAISLELMRTLDQARSQSDLLRDLLKLLVEHAARAVVLVIRGTSISAWSGAGFDDPERLKQWQGELSASPTFSTFSEEARPLRFAPGSDPLVTGWLGSDPAPAEAMILPVCLRGKVMGGIYIDRVDGKPWNTDVAQSLVAMTCWLIDTLPYRQTVPSPMLAEGSVVPGLEPVVEEPAFEAETVPEPEPELELETEPEPEPAPEVDTVPEPEVETVPEPDPEAVTPAPPDMAAAMPAVEEEFDPSATVRVEMPPAGVAPQLGDAVPAETVQQPVPTAEAVAEPAPAPEPEARPEPPAVQPVVPPPSDAEPSAPAAPGEPVLSPEEEARHEEARRFARLLVSEIKLYNEEEVEKGRAGKDLYQRLKEDIDRSREMFDKRIPPEVRAVRDYFHDELVRILGDGDPDSLGM